MQMSSIWQHLLHGAQSRIAGGFLSLLVLVLVAAGCAPSAAAPAAQPTSAPIVQPTAMPAASATPAAAASGTTSGGGAASEGVLVNLAKKDNFGLFLVDEKGMTLYLFTKDTANTSNCYNGCAAAWPPLLTDGAPRAGTGVTASLLGTTTRKDGKMQVTYNGNPLYYYAEDQKPGDITGQGVGGIWFVVSPRGSGMTGAKAPAAGAPQATAVPKTGGSY